MKTGKKTTPPAWATKLLEWYCRPDLLEDLQGDLNEYFERNLKAKGAKRARWIYCIDVIKFFRLYTVRKPQPPTLMNVNIVNNYFKTSMRNMARNKLFTAINVIGLAISMSVGLILIAFIMELQSFDKFNVNYDRIYRVINSNEYLNDKAWFASTSVLLGKEIEEYLPSKDDVVIMRRGFSKDFEYNGKTIPLNGLWASASIFNIFSFELVSGNAKEALKEPYSIVLTESAARKLFDDGNALGKLVKVDTSTYTVTAIAKDPPINSHFTFQILGSFSTIDREMINKNDPKWLKWNNMWLNYVYVLAPENGMIENLQNILNQISEKQNKTIDSHSKIHAHLQPLNEVVIARDLSNNIGFNYEEYLLWVLAALAIVIILSACFNYTNLSIARSLRRSREVGVRKVSGASGGQIFFQFMFEAVVVALISLAFSVIVFYFVRPEFLSLDNSLQSYISLQPGVKIYVMFISMAIGVGVLAGGFPALFFARLNSVAILKNISSLKLFRHVNMRKGLILFQYTLTLMFVVGVTITYKQYKYALSFDLGFSTENILNIELQGNKPDQLIKELGELPEVKGLSKSQMTPSIGTTFSAYGKFKDPEDSVYLRYNIIDENYLALHNHELLAGHNFQPVLAEDAPESQVIVNEEVLKHFNMGTPETVIGEMLKVDGVEMSIVGVVRNFHYNVISEPINAFAFRYDPKKAEIVNAKIATNDIDALMHKIETKWKKIDPVHPLEASFYNSQIEKAYHEMSGYIKIIGFITFLAISISTLGLLGMVVFSTETRVKEIGIRKAMGASEKSLLLLLSRGFIILLLVSASIALPVTYLLFEQILLADLAFKAPIGFFELFSGLIVVVGIALLAISSQTTRVVRINPSHVLRSE